MDGLLTLLTASLVIIFTNAETFITPRSPIVYTELEDVPENKSCPQHFRPCPLRNQLDTKCMLESFWCDGVLDCHGDIDELYCFNPTTTRLSTANCTLGAETPAEDPSMSFSGLSTNGSDIASCYRPSCQDPYKECWNGQCLNNERFCDKKMDCVDGSDEWGCAYSEHTTVSCLLHGARIPHEKVCDGKVDCPHNLDEFNCASHRCFFPRSQCLPFCPRNGQGSCTCPYGMELSSDKTQCIDIDECKQSSPCDQLCFNTIPAEVCEGDCSPFSVGYVCGCVSGYVLENRTKCVPRDWSFQLVVVNSSVVHLDGFAEGTQHRRRVMVESVHALDVFGQAGMMLYRSGNTLLSLNLTDPGSIPEPVIRDLPPSAVFCVDWIGRHVFWTGEGMRTIRAHSMETGRSFDAANLLGTEIPLQLVCDSYHGYLYWFAWVLGRLKLHRKAMDGSSESSWTLEQSFNRSVSSLAIDYHGQRLTWFEEVSDAFFFFKLEDFFKAPRDQGDSSRSKYQKETPFLYSGLLKTRKDLMILPQMDHYSFLNSAPNPPLWRTWEVINVPLSRRQVFLFHPSQQPGSSLGRPRDELDCVISPQPLRWNCQPVVTSSPQRTVQSRTTQASLADKNSTESTSLLSPSEVPSHHSSVAHSVSNPDPCFQTTSSLAVLMPSVHSLLRETGDLSAMEKSNPVITSNGSVSKTPSPEAANVGLAKKPVWRLTRKRVSAMDPVLPDSSSWSTPNDPALHCTTASHHLDAKWQNMSQAHKYDSYLFTTVLISGGLLLMIGILVFALYSTVWRRRRISRMLVRFTAPRGASGTYFSNDLGSSKLLVS